MLQEPRIPSACPVDTFVAPVHSVAESMDQLREAMPDINWNAWANVEPTFRSIAEWEMSAAHAKAHGFKALKTWWEINNESVQSCLAAAEPHGGQVSSTDTEPVSASRSSTPQPNLLYEQIERRANSERRTVDHMIAPEPIKQEAREQISDAAAVDRYVADLGRGKG
ncbi:MAG: hypothetical protein M3N91_07085 [Pseudomonadota bacterium]|nr:hypothetical protein [Pseudomonadota bacterium]